MCDTGRDSLPVPRWGRLYAIPSVAVVVLITVRCSLTAAAARAGLELGLAAVTLGAMVWWVRANSAALDLLEWCGCASAAVTVRLIGAEEHAARPATDGMGERRAVESATGAEGLAEPARRS